MEIKNNQNPMFHMLVKGDNGSKIKLSHDLTHQTYESIEEMAKVFGFVNERCPNISMWFTLGSVTPVEENTENKL